MIPKFKEYLNESVWGDLRKKSLGQEVRVENDIDLMDIDGFMEYLKDRYICTKARRRWKVEHWFLGGENTLMQIDMPIEDISEPGIKMTYCLRLTYDYGKKECIDIASSFQTFFEEYPEFKKYVSDNYQLIKKSKDDFRTFGSDDLIVSKPGEELKFHNYVELIEKALSCVKKPYLKMAMNESVWGDIRKKSLGTEKRIEEDIDRLSYDDFVKYIKCTYECTNNYDIRTTPSISSPSLMLIEIPIYEDITGSIPMVTINYQTNSGLYSSFDNEQPTCVAISRQIFYQYPELENLLKEYDIEKPEKRAYVIDTKGKLKNSDCVNILDIVLSVVPEPLYVKK